MKALAITLRGIEDITALEIKELIKKGAVKEEGCVTFDFKKYEDLFLLSYKAQSVSGVLLLFFEFEIRDLRNTISDFIKKISKESISEWAGKGTTFKVACQRTGKHEFSSQDFANEAGRIIGNKTKAKVNLENPDTIFYAFLTEKKGYFGIDFAGIELSKRDYNIFAHPASISPILAYTVVRMSGYDKKGAFIDTFGKSGLIAIEAALYAAEFPANYYRKDKLAFLALKPFSKFDFDRFFKKIDKKADFSSKSIYCADSLIGNVRAAEKNAKIAGVNKIINFSRIDVSWLDTKFKKNQIKFAATLFSILKNEDYGKIAKEFFYQFEYILEKNGRIAIMAKNPEILEKYALEYKFRLAEKREITRGNEKSFIMVFLPKP